MSPQNALPWFALAIYLVLLVQYFVMIRFNSLLVVLALAGSVIAAVIGTGELVRGTTIG